MMKVTGDSVRLRGVPLDGQAGQAVALFGDDRDRGSEDCD